MSALQTIVAENGEMSILLVFVIISLYTGILLFNIPYDRTIKKGFFTKTDHIFFR